MSMVFLDLPPEHSLPKNKNPKFLFALDPEVRSTSGDRKGNFLE
jgi:hypothetical protein